MNEPSPRSPADTRRQIPLFAIVLPVFGLLALYAAIGTWMGVARAVGGTRTPGTVTGVACGTRSSNCTGTFTSDDGRIDGRRVVVHGAAGGTRRAHGTYVPRIDNGLTGAIQSDDTVYVGTVDISVGGAIAMGVLLSLVAIALLLPFLAIGVRYLFGRRPGRSPRSASST